MPPNFRNPIFRLAARYSDPPSAAYEALQSFYSSTQTIDGKEIALQALGRTPDPDLARDLFAFALSPAVQVQDAHTPLVALAANSATRDTLWDCVSGQWEALMAKSGGSVIVKDRFVRVTLARFASAERAAEIRAFFAGKDVSEFRKALNIALDTIAGNASYKARDLERTREFLVANGYVNK